MGVKLRFFTMASMLGINPLHVILRERPAEVDGVERKYFPTC
jgi:hypothetical protein